MLLISGPETRREANCPDCHSLTAQGDDTRPVAPTLLVWASDPRVSRSPGPRLQVEQGLQTRLLGP